jgi:hypothetical protein
MRHFGTDDAIYVLRVTFAHADQDDIFWSDTMHGIIKMHCNASKVEWPGEGMQCAMIDAGRYWFQGIPAPERYSRELFHSSVPNTVA